MLEEKLKKGLKMIGEYAGGGDDDSGLDIGGGGGTETPLEMEEPIDPESLSINLKVSIKTILNANKFCQMNPRNNLFHQD